MTVSEAKTDKTKPKLNRETDRTVLKSSNPTSYLLVPGIVPSASSSSPSLNLCVSLLSLHQVISLSLFSLSPIYLTGDAKSVLY